MSTRTLVAAAALVVVAALSGCQGSNTRDLKGVPAKNPSKTELYANVDNHPNIVRLCIDGIAFVTTSREMDPLLRVPEWDAWCKS